MVDECKDWSCLDLKNGNVGCSIPVRPAMDDICHNEGDMLFTLNSLGAINACDEWAAYGHVLYGVCHRDNNVMYAVRTTGNSFCAENAKFYCNASGLTYDICSGGDCLYDAIAKEAICSGSVETCKDDTYKGRCEGDVRYYCENDRVRVEWCNVDAGFSCKIWEASDGGGSAACLEKCSKEQNNFVCLSTKEAMWVSCGPVVGETGLYGSKTRYTCPTACTYISGFEICY